jgi:hypothetical protein
MTRRMRKSLLVAVLHVMVVGSLGAKLLADRMTRPRVWARTAPVDPSLPIRGRYVRLRVEAAPAPDFPSAPLTSPAPRRFTGDGLVFVTLTAQSGRLVAESAHTPNRRAARIVQRGAERVVILDEPLMFFIPEHAADPSRRALGEELWVEVTIPRAGAPRPIQLGVKKDGVLTPLELH